MMEDKNAEKFKSWAKRLECPVDEDAGYHNTFVSLSNALDIPELMSTVVQSRLDTDSP